MAINNVINAPIPFAVSKGGTGATSLTDGGVLLGSGTDPVTPLAVATDGQLIIGSSGSDPSMATLTAGTNISITNGAGTIEIGTSADVIWNNQTEDTVTMTANNGYVINSTNQCTLTMPTDPQVGDVFRIAGNAPNGWVLQAEGTSVLWFGDDQSTNGGTITSTNRYDCIELVVVDDDTVNEVAFVLSAQGNMTVA